MPQARRIAGPLFHRLDLNTKFFDRIHTDLENGMR